MLAELKKYDHLGTPNFFHLLLQQMLDHESAWTIKTLNEIFANQIIDGRMDFYGCIIYAKSIDLLISSEEDMLSLNPIFIDCLVNVKYLQNKILEQTFAVFSKTDEFHKIFNSKYISYDVIYNNIEIKNSAFKFKYANFKQFLIDFEFIFPHPDMPCFIINRKYKKLFDKHILPPIKKEKLGIEGLYEQIEKNRIYGEEAEEFVVMFEKQRLADHKHIKKIQKISDYDVSAGYDIVSFDSNDSENIDRFIEVKSFDGQESFYWSRNEIDVARIKKSEYYLYLVNRSKMNGEGYEPTIIQNPYEHVLNNDAWNKRIEKYFINI